MRQRIIPRLMGLGRVAAFGTIVFGAIGGLAARSVYGDVGEASLSVGHQLANLDDLTSSGSRILLNGEEMFFSATVVSSSPKEVLDRFEALCREGSKDLDEAIHQPATGEAAVNLGILQKMGPAGLGIVRREKKREGAVVCVARETNGGITGLRDRFISFSKTHDLADIGKLRYVFVSAQDATHVRVLTAWTDGGFRFDNLVPPPGQDAPGSDVENAPRPAGSIRRLTAAIEGAPTGFRFYETSASTSDIIGTYDQLLPKNGWQSVPTVKAELSDTRVFNREGVELVISAMPQHGKTVVTMAESRRNSSH